MEQTTKQTVFFQFGNKWKWILFFEILFFSFQIYIFSLNLFIQVFKVFFLLCFQLSSFNSVPFSKIKVSTLYTSNKVLLSLTLSVFFSRAFAKIWIFSAFFLWEISTWIDEFLFYFKCHGLISRILLCKFWVISF